MQKPFYPRALCWTARIAMVGTLVLAHFSAQSFQVLPKVSDVDRKLAKLGKNKKLDPLGQFIMSSALPLLKSPVHEAITLSTMGCNPSAGEENACVALKAIQKNRVFLYGVRWPDDPPFALNKDAPPAITACDPKVTLRSTAQPKCWMGLFNDAAAKAKPLLAKNPGVPAYGPGHYLLYRSHFGDLQFFHSMAAYDGERAFETQARMKMWAKFLWGIAIGQVPKDKPIRTLGFDELTPYFPGDMTVTNLFATGIVDVRKNLDQVALGVLLHMVQDSFSQAHADRGPEPGGQCERLPRFSRPGKITQFYSYARQAGHLHDEEDTFDALGLQTLQTSPHVIDVSRAFVTLWKEKASWERASLLFDCTFELQNPEAPGGPGRYMAPANENNQAPSNQYSIPNESPGAH